jgi:uncharacterized lipoprotein YddW (UPF0748 family)
MLFVGLRIKHGYLILVFWCVFAAFIAACAAPVPSPAKEARCVWLHRFEYCQATSTFDQDSIRAYIANVIHQAADANFNILFFQVRGNGDAYYTPGLEPWGNLLTGILGEDPGWDPLEFALELAHERGLELHAWLNTFPIWRGRIPPPSTQPPSPYLAHPEWVVSDSAGIPMPLSDGYVSFSPGVPGAQEHIISVVTDLVRRYDIDGVHFDYIRYPEGAPDSGYSHDAISVERFHSSTGNPFQLDWHDWQREQLTQFISRAYNIIMREKPWLKVSASVIGSYSAGGWNAYHVAYQDPRRWTELGKMDFITPMIYWPRTQTSQPFMVRSREWLDHFTLDRYVFPGIGSYRYNTDEKPYTWAEAEGQVQDLRKYGIRGMAFFNAHSLSTRWQELGATLFSNPANPPPMPWKDDQPPQPPSRLRAAVKDEHLTVSWVTPDDDDVQHFNIYLSRKLPINTWNSRNLFEVTPGPRLEWTVTPKSAYEGFYIAVSALDRAWNESGLSEPLRIE